MNMPNVPIKDFCINGTCEKLEQLQAENENLRDAWDELIERDDYKAAAINRVIKLWERYKGIGFYNTADKIKAALDLATNTPQPPQNRSSQ